MTADMSPESPSTAVKRRYRDSMLPARHLSCPSANIPYFPPSLQEKVRVTSNAVSQPDRFRKRMFSIPHTINLDESGQLDYKIMSWKDQHSDRPVPPIPCKAYDRCAPKLLRSTSVADLYSQPSYMEYCSTSQVSHLPSSAWNFRGAATNEASIQEEQDVSPTSSPQASSAAPPHARRPTLPHSVSETVVTEKKLRRRTRYKSYHDLHILSMYQDNASVSSLNSTHSSSFKSDVDEDEPVEELTHSDTSSQESLPLPETPSDLEVTCEPSAIGRAITKSASPNHSHARHASVIDYNHEKRYSLDEDIGEFMPMQATMLTVPGRAKLIQIHRPQPLRIVPRHLTSHHDPLEPTTPTLFQNEISSFSPYDTPRSGTPFSDMSRTASEATPTQNWEPRLIVQDDGEISPTQLQTPSYRLLSSRNSERSYASQSSSKPLFTNPFGSPLSQCSKASVGESTLIEDSPSNPVPSARKDTNYFSEPLIFDRINPQEAYDSSLSKAVAATIKAFDVMAFDGFHLHSPELLPFHNQRLDQSTDSMLVASLRKIFPQAQQTLLSTIAAWLIVDQHFTYLMNSAPPRLPSLEEDDHDDEDQEDEDDFTPRRTTVVSASRNNSVVHIAPQGQLRKGSAYDLFVSPGGPVNIPSKARSILGIHTNPIGSTPHPVQRGSVNHRSRAPSTTTEDHARSVQASVQTLGRKLVRDLMHSPELSMPRGAARPKSSRGRGSVSASRSASPSAEAMEDAVSGMWEACRCIVSML